MEFVFLQCKFIKVMKDFFYAIQDLFVNIFLVDSMKYNISLSEIIKDEILIRYYYKNGSYLNKLKKDTVILEAVKILKNKSTYAKILKGV